jgi:hypothetical protein
MAEAPNVATMSDPSSPRTVSVGDIAPTPTDDEVVAIMAAVEARWPKPLHVVDSAPRRRTTWRFSGRWWSRPVPARRDRPYR